MSVFLMTTRPGTFESVQTRDENATQVQEFILARHDAIHHRDTLQTLSNKIPN